MLSATTVDGLTCTLSEGVVNDRWNEQIQIEIARQQLLSRTRPLRFCASLHKEPHRAWERFAIRFGWERDWLHPCVELRLWQWRAYLGWT